MEHKKYGTDFTETEALLAVAEEDYGHVEALIKNMLPGEKRQLIVACNELAAMLRSSIY